MALSPAEFQKRLEVISLDADRVPYGRVAMLHEAQGKYGMVVTKYSGHLALADAYKSVWLETFELLNNHSRPKVTQPLSEFYPQLMTRVVHGFQSLCAAELTANHGYPHHAYTLLRNVFDDAVMTSAALQKWTTFYAIEGLSPPEPFEPKAMKRNRKNTEREIRRLMTGENSGLTSETRLTLEKWDALFDFETHGGRLTLAAGKDYLLGSAPLPFVPLFNEMQFAMFANRFAEVGWVLHRLLPAIQPAEAPLPAEWQTKWQVLDEAFREAVMALTTDLGKPFGKCYVEFVEAKFPFKADSIFPL